MEQQFTPQASHTISLFVANKPGVLLRICLVFSRRGFNIESLVVSPAFDGRFSRMTITAQGEKKTLDQIIKQCAKLVDVIHASEHNAKTSVEKEFALIKVDLKKENRVEILQLTQHFQAEALDFSDNTLVFQIVGDTEKINTCLSMLNPFGILEMVRSGKMVITKGQEAT
jgi:acetolactate synthase I/III small subunit